MTQQTAEARKPPLRVSANARMDLWEKRFMQRDLGRTRRCFTTAVQVVTIYRYCDLCPRSYTSGRDRVCQQRLANKRGLFTKGRQSSRQQGSEAVGSRLQGGIWNSCSGQGRPIVCTADRIPPDGIEGNKNRNSWRGIQYC